SSRRRHTRSKRDWSSDVCSSDLGILARDSERNGGIVNHHPNFPVGKTVPESRSVITDRHCSRGVQVRKQLHGFDVFTTVYRKLITAGPAPTKAAGPACEVVPPRLQLPCQMTAGKPWISGRSSDLFGSREKLLGGG